MNSRLIFWVETFNTWVGKASSWSIVLLTFSMSYEVFVRYVLNAPTEWAFDASYMLYGVLFMLAGPYTLARNAHVRGDFMYRKWAPRRQATMDLVLYILFFFPGILAFIYSGWDFAKLSWMMNEHSAASPNGPPVYHFKALVPITGVLMLLQGLVESARCVVCIQTGQWPSRFHDVEEMENVILEEVKEKGLDAKLKEIEQHGGHL